MSECGCCRDCDWWCKPAEYQDDYGECRLADGLDGGSRQYTKAYASDMESYRASLKCLADFGCVQFEGKPAAGREGE